MESIICKNCGAELEAKFCSQCGQKKQTRISLRQIGSDVYNGLFDFESPFLKTLFCLTVNPGKVYREYLEGARQRYFSPVRYSIWIMTLMVAIAAITDTVLVDFSQYQFADLLSSPELQNNLDTFQAVFNSLIIPSFFLSAFVVAGFIRLCFRTEKYTFAELYLPSLLSISHISLVYGVSLLIGVYYEIWAQLIILILTMAYMCWGLSEIYFPTRAKNYWKCLLAIVLAFIATMVLSFIPGVILGMMSVK